MSETLRMSGDQVVKIVFDDNSIINMARKAFKEERSKIAEAILGQAHTFPPVEMRRMEIEAVIKIFAAAGVDIKALDRLPEETRETMPASRRNANISPR